MSSYISNLYLTLVELLCIYIFGFIFDHFWNKWKVLDIVISRDDCIRMNKMMAMIVVQVGR